MLGVGRSIGKSDCDKVVKWDLMEFSGQGGVAKCETATDYVDV